MKKPNITDGEWSYKKNLSRNKWLVASSETDICEMNFLYDSQEANAKAISAVPEMIDALMVINESDEARKAMGSVARTKMIEALEKAGCYE